ncbi:MAG: ParA family protein [Candidatus Peribacteraceae bacterium]|nr:ParA family protein [Candidatus Peribacteraceae bacterium]
MSSPSDRRAKVITVINLKGGVGKTHTAWLLAGVCQERGKKLLVVDTDT